jgi:hypothetical protein
MKTLLSATRQSSRMRLLPFLALVLLPAVAFAQVQLDVAPTKKTTMTGQRGGGTSHTLSYVDRVTLAIALTGKGEIEEAKAKEDGDEGGDSQSRLPAKERSRCRRFMSRAIHAPKF